MKSHDELMARLSRALDRDDAINLLRRAIGRESITGNEANVVSLLEDEMRARGIGALCRRDFLPGRPNISGEKKGTGGGQRLLLIGHTDTVRVDGWREHWAGSEREDPFSAPIIDGRIWGRGAGDLPPLLCWTAPESSSRVILHLRLSVMRKAEKKVRVSLPE